VAKVVNQIHLQMLEVHVEHAMTIAALHTDWRMVQLAFHAHPHTREQNSATAPSPTGGELAPLQDAPIAAKAIGTLNIASLGSDRAPEQVVAVADLVWQHSLDTLALQ
jgi:hypothetical protein